MKIYKIVLTAGTLAVAVEASAVTEFNDAGTMTIGSPSISLKPSQNVIIRYLPSTVRVPSGAGVISFTLSSFHSSGTKMFATSSSNRKIFMKDARVISDPPPAPAADDSANFTGYTEL